MRTVQKYADGTIQAVCLLAGLGILFLPLVLIYLYQEERGTGSQLAGAEVAVGVAVMLRTTFRRLLRAGTTNLLRTSLGAFSRTSARAMTRTLSRRLARVAARVVLRVLTVRPDTMSALTPEVNSGALSGVAVVLGFLALALSFAFVATHQTTAVSHAYSISQLSLLAAFPLLVYVAASYSMARRFGTRIRVNTALDGLLLQAYFAGAGSFLPMTTDIEYEADESTRFRIATRVLLILYVSHLALQWIAVVFDFPAISTLASFLLLYSFVYSFPIRPLEGFSVWKGSRVVWLLLCVPILVSFLAWLPPAIMDLL